MQPHFFIFAHHLDTFPLRVDMYDRFFIMTSAEEQPFDFLKYASGLSDCCSAKPDGYKIVAENSTGRLIKMTLKAGEEDAPHDHPKHYMYLVANGKLTIKDWSSGSAGEANTAELPSGAPPIMPSGSHFFSVCSMCINQGRTAFLFTLVIL